MKLFFFAFLKYMLIVCYFYNCFTLTWANFENADTRFEFSSTQQRLSIKVYERNNLLLDQILDIHSPQTFAKSNCILQRHKNGYKLNYKGADASSLSFWIDFDSHVHFEPQSQTNFSRKKTWGIKTQGHLINKYDHLFYNMYTRAKAFHNYGLLKFLTCDLKQNYGFNRGIIYIGDKTEILDKDMYTAYLNFIQKEAQPYYKDNQFEDYGVFLVDGPLQITKLNYHAKGYTDIDHLILKENASLIIDNEMTVNQTIQGQADRIDNHGLFMMNTMDSPDFTLHHWNNTGTVYFRNGSNIEPLDSFNNEGSILCADNFSFTSLKKTNKVGSIISEGALKAIIHDLVHETAGLQGLKDAFLAAKKGKIRLLLKYLQHTDHYLNTITNHTVQNQFGSITNCYTTETGYVFQRRTTEVKEEIIEQEVPFSEQLQKLMLDMMLRQSAINNLKKHLKDKLALIGKVNSNYHSLITLLAKVLMDLGLDQDEAKNVLSEDDLNHLLQKITIFDLYDARDENRFADNKYKSYLEELAGHALQSGQTLLQWINRNSGAFIDILCRGVRGVSPFIKHPVVQNASRVCMMRTAYQQARHMGQPSADMPNSTYSKKPNLTAIQREQLQGVKLVGKNPGNIAPDRRGRLRVDSELLGGERAARELYTKLTGERLTASATDARKDFPNGDRIMFRSVSRSEYPKIEITTKTSNNRIILEKITFR